jgi:carboxynorspermidine decarboxylase
MDVAVLDCSAETHMPDVLAMPYRPNLIGSGQAGEKNHTYRLGGISCLAGDVIGDYSFDKPLKRGDRLVFTDMALYSFVKNTNFNGVELPSIITFSLENDTLDIVRRFGYEDYLSRIS